MSSTVGKWAVAVAVALLTSACSFNVEGLGPLPGAAPNAYACACQCRTQPTLELSVSAGVDDAEQDLTSGSVGTTSNDLELVDAFPPLQVVGVRLRNVSIPAGATIVSASLQFTTAEVSTGPSSVVFAAEAADDAAPYAPATNDLTSRTRTAARVTWVTPPWPTVGEAGAAQRTPELAALVQEVVGRPGWASGHALSFLIGGDGSSGRRTAASFDGSATGAPRLTVTYLAPAAEAVALDEQVCVPAELNPNLTGGGALTDAQLQADCAGRVQDTLSGLAAACGTYPSVCTCAATPASARLVASCDAPCTEVPLAPGCTNFDPAAGNTTATNAPGDAPVCITASPLSAGMFGQTSLCAASGSAAFTADDETKTPGARGVVALRGRPCPAGGCRVGLRFGFDLDPVTFSSLFGSATFEDLSAQGKSVPGQEPLLSSAGAGLVPVGATSNTVRGRRGGDVRGYLGGNADALDLQVRYGSVAPSCSLSGALVGSTDPELERCEPFGPDASKVCASDADCADVPDCSDGDCGCAPVGASETTLAFAVSGPLVNQPPTAVAGADQTVECDAAGAATVTLSSASTDPDGNLRQVSWLRGGRTGPAVSTAPEARVVQAVGTAQTYVLRVVDALGQGDEGSTQVRVVDTTPPAIACNAPSTLTPRDGPVSFRATASDVCDPAATPSVVDFGCVKLNAAGKVVDKTHSCKVTYAGDTLTVWHTGGVGTRITWDVAVTDASGNTATRTCALDTVVPGRP